MSHYILISTILLYTYTIEFYYHITIKMVDIIILKKEALRALNKWKEKTAHNAKGMD